MSKDSYFTGQPVYSQVLKLLEKEKILQLSCTTPGSESYVKRFDGYQHLVVMLFSVLKHFDSLRELEIGMKAEDHKLRHFWKKKVRSLILRGFGQIFYAHLSFTGQQYMQIWKKRTLP